MNIQTKTEAFTLQRRKAGGGTAAGAMGLCQ